MSRSATAATHWEGQEIAFWRERWKVPELHVFEQIGSTNDVARQLANDGARAGTLVLAEVQSSGRGRFGRRWLTPPGKALLMSCLARPRVARDTAPGTLPLRVGLAAASAIEAVALLHVDIKWPNDLLATRRKVGGILCEATSSGDALSIIIGIGINVHQTADDWPPELRSAAVSIDAAADANIDRAELVTALLERLRPLLHAPLRPLDDDELAAFAQRDALAGRDLIVFTAERNIERGGAVVLHGSGAGIASDGALLLRTAERTERITTGTVRIADDRNDRSAGAQP